MALIDRSRQDVILYDSSPPQWRILDCLAWGWVNRELLLEKAKGEDDLKKGEEEAHRRVGLMGGQQ